MKHVLPQPSKRNWLERQGFFYRVDTALEQLAADGFCVVMANGEPRPPTRYTTSLIGFPDYRLRMEQRWCLPIRFTVELQTSDAAAVWRSSGLFVTYNSHGLISFLLRSRFEKLAPVVPGRVPYARKTVRDREA